MNDELATRRHNKQDAIKDQENRCTEALLAASAEFKKLAALKENTNRHDERPFNE